MIKARNKRELNRAVEGLLEAIDLVVWDFDGVVADTEPAQAEAYRRILISLGHDPHEEFFSKYIGYTELEIWNGIAEEFGLHEDVRELRNRRLRELVENTTLQLKPAWFVRPLRVSFRSAQHVVVSSGNRSVIDVLLRRWNLEFDRISAWEPGKPAAAKEQSLISEIEAAGEVIVIEDNSKYLRLAGQQGATTFGIKHSMNRGQILPCDVLIYMNEQ